VPANGTPRQLKDARVTIDRAPVDSVVCVKARGMQEAWCLAVGGRLLTGATAVTCDARRCTIEESCRDTKDPRYGLGLSGTHVHDGRRRDRLLLISAMARTWLTVLGAAGESLGMDRMLKANTVKTRTHSLFRQGGQYYAAIPAMKQELLEPLVQRFGEYVLEQPLYVQAFSLK
jgi:hypothetical protein